MLRRILSLGLLFAVGCSDTLEPAPQRTEVPIQQTLSELQGLAFDSFVDESYKAWLTRFPEQVTLYELESEVGLRPRWLNDISYDYADRTAQLEDGIIDLLAGYEEASLTPDQRIIRDAYRWFYEDLARARTL